MSSSQISLYSIGEINFTTTLQICILQNHNLSANARAHSTEPEMKSNEKKNHKFLLKLHKWNVYRVERYCALFDHSFVMLVSQCTWILLALFSAFKQSGTLDFFSPFSFSQRTEKKKKNSILIHFYGHHFKVGNKSCTKQQLGANDCKMHLSRSRRQATYINVIQNMIFYIVKQ